MMTTLTALLADIASELVSWKEFGLAGAVIFSLFAVLGLLVKWLVGHIDAQAKAHLGYVERQAQEHRQEREGWEEENTKNAQRVEVAIRELTAAIRGMRDWD